MKTNTFKIIKKKGNLLLKTIFFPLILSLIQDDPVSSQDIDNSNQLPSNAMTQINSVSNLRDVSPTDWAYEALRGLVENYGCIAGYPNKTFRGNRALSRYEFAAGLNSCLNELERLISENLVKKEDIEILKRLTQEFQAELKILGQKIDNLESRIAFLEDHQFSTTTKLLGNIVTQTNFYFGANNKAQAALQYNAFLATLTSFTGKDTLLVGLASTNTTFPELANTNNGRNVGSTREATAYAASAGDLNNSLRLINLNYDFPVTNNLRATVTGVNRFNFSPIFLNNFATDYTFGNGPVSAFATAPPIYLVGGGNGGVALTYKMNPSTILSLNYMSTFGNDPSIGLFKGDYVTTAEIKYNPTSKFFVQGLYQKGYFAPGNFGFNNGQFFQGNGFIGTALANRFDDAGVLFDSASAVSTNAYQIGGYYVFNPRFSLGGWGNLINARLLGKGDAQIWTYSLQAAFPDLFKEGNLGGIVVGVEPTLTGLNTNIPHSEFKNDTSLHIETYYRHQINDHISFTPYLIWITAPNQDRNNSDLFVGGFRTVFSF
ncbi:iron uptake porin [Geminocystis sp. GBBB08]|uniref:iron uptake porin n=1 Tax=Geminocystis sp. GBBB08 TaxID=2604140 RepID=UPI0027E234F5|nr:iron uptake porin [Geminocystis sp. GBBB08]MBL1210516.1 porin [Geminocystis sp. GBBB08]